MDFKDFKAKDVKLKLPKGWKFEGVKRKGGKPVWLITNKPPKPLAQASLYISEDYGGVLRVSLHYTGDITDIKKQDMVILQRGFRLTKAGKNDIYEWSFDNYMSMLDPIEEANEVIRKSHKDFIFISDRVNVSGPGGKSKFFRQITQKEINALKLPVGWSVDNFKKGSWVEFFKASKVNENFTGDVRMKLIGGELKATVVFRLLTNDVPVNLATVDSIDKVLKRYGFKSKKKSKISSVWQKEIYFATDTKGEPLSRIAGRLSDFDAAFEKAEAYIPSLGEEDRVTGNDFKRGDRIICKFDDGDMYIGSVTAKRKGLIYVLFDDGDKFSFELTSKLIIGRGIRRKTRKDISKDLNKWLVK